MAEASQQDQERVRSYIAAMKAMDDSDPSEAKLATVRAARRILTTMYLEPHAYAKPVSLPDSFPDELATYGLDKLEKAARMLSRMGAVELKVHRQGLKPTRIALAHVPAGPIN